MDQPPRKPDKRPPAGPRKKKDEPNPLVLVGAGAELAGVVAVLALGGYWADGKLGTEPWLLLVGVAIGFIGGFYNLWKQARKFF